jgi:hypothetical protein
MRPIKKIGELYKLCSKALKDNLGINFAKFQSMTAYFFKYIVEMEITLSRLGLLNKKLNKLI